MINSKVIAKSDKRIQDAKEALNSSPRGKAAIKDLRKLFSGVTSGLDSIGLEAVLALVEEFAKNHRRGFLG